ncbi:MAG: hypothetical protein HND57_05605 [Planctomycetes bacterium]|nr:hypothetical protein [Planctomycetota bacterium]
MIGVIAALALAFGVGTGECRAQGQWLEQQKLTLGPAGNHFGWWVDMEEDVAVICRHGGIGMAYVYRHNAMNDAWELEATLDPGDLVPGVREYGLRASISGNWIVVGSQYDDESGTDAGAAYLWHYETSDWVLSQKLTAWDAEPGAWFGSGCGISGEWMMVGSSKKDDGVTDSGAAYVYKWNGSSWAYVQKLARGETPTANQFGEYSPDLTAEYAIVGARLDDEFAGNAGAIYLYSRSGNVWSLDGKFLPTAGSGGISYGIGTSIDGQWAVAGAQFAGPVYVYRNEGGVWSEYQQLLPPDVVAGDYFGHSVTVRGNAILAAAFGADGARGAAYIYRYNDQTTYFELEQRLTASDAADRDYLGTGVAIDEPVALVGAYLDDNEHGSDAGAVYAFNSNQNPVADAGPDITVEAVNEDGAPVTLVGTGSFDPDGDPLGYMWDLSDASVILDDPTSCCPSGIFPMGVTTVNLTVTDGQGGISVDQVFVTVQDTTPPDVRVTTDITMLWPPNHTMQEVTVYVLIGDECSRPEDVQLVSATITSDEPDDAIGDGDGSTTGDVDGRDGYVGPVDFIGALVLDPEIGLNGGWFGTVQLRAERDGDSDGRAYAFDIEVRDSSGNAATTSCVVVVPHDRRGGKEM